MLALEPLPTLSSKTYSYDLAGNIASKSDIAGTYSYGSVNQPGVIGDAGPHAVQSAGGTTYDYDDNGNLILRDSGMPKKYVTVDWTVYNKPARFLDFGTPGNSRAFTYGVHRRRCARTG